MRAPLIALLALTGLALMPLASAQKLRDKSKPINDPVQCPYCGGEAELLAAAGLISHGGFEFGKIDTAKTDALMVGSDIRWVETQHFKIGIGIGTGKVDGDDRNKIRAECDRLRLALPEVPEKPRRLDPWLRLHLYAQRLEDHYTSMSKFLGVEDKDFPAAGTLWNGQGTFMGTGPILGMPRKLEVLVLPSESALTRYLRESYGLIVKQTQRWHIVELGTLQVVAHQQQGSLKKDAALHAHLLFTSTQMLLNAFKHYSYDIPIWLMEGMGHLMERRLSPEYNTFSSSEGGVADLTRKKDWEPPVFKLAKSGKLASFATLTGMRDFADLDLDRSFATWSIVDFLEREHPGFMSGLLHAIKGVTNESHIPDGSKLIDIQRDFFRSSLKLTYAQLDRQWKAWILETYRAK